MSDRNTYPTITKVTVDGETFEVVDDIETARRISIYFDGNHVASSSADTEDLIKGPHWNDDRADLYEAVAKKFLLDAWEASEKRVAFLQALADAHHIPYGTAPSTKPS